MKRVRITVSKLHRWSGLALGLYIALIAISGAAMVFQAKLFEWEFGADIMAFEERSEAWVLPSVWLEKAEERYGPLGHVEGIFGPETTPMRIATPTIIYDGIRSNGKDGHGVIVVDPYTGTPKTRFIAEDTAAVWPLWLHNSMFTGGFEILTLMVFSILTMIFCISGTYLWLQKSNIKKDDFKLAGFSSPPKMRKSHTALGIWLGIPLFLFALTGFGLARLDLTMNFAELLGRADSVVASENHSECETSSADKVWMQALELNPGSDFKMFFFPSETNAGYQMFMGPAATRYPTRGNSEVRIVSNCSQLTYFRPAESNQLGDKLLTYMLDIHNGKVLGIVGETVIFILGLIIFLLPITGISAHVWRASASQKKRKISRN